MKGFSRANLYRMKRFCAFYAGREESVARIVDRILCEGARSLILKWRAWSSGATLQQRDCMMSNLDSVRAQSWREVVALLAALLLRLLRAARLAAILVERIRSDQVELKCPTMLRQQSLPEAREVLQQDFGYSDPDFEDSRGHSGT